MFSVLFFLMSMASAQTPGAGPNIFEKLKNEGIRPYLCTAFGEHWLKKQKFGDKSISQWVFSGNESEAVKTFLSKIYARPESSVKDGPVDRLTVASVCIGTWPEACNDLARGSTVQIMNVECKEPKTAPAK